MAVAKEDEVRKVLGPYEDALSTIVTDAWDKWRAMNMNGQLMFPARSRACLVFDFIAQNAMAAFGSDAKVHTIEGNETVRFVFDQRVALRFKKANDSGLGSHIGTQAALGFADPEQQFPGFPDVHKIEIVYRLNVLETSIEHVEVVARDCDKCLWSYSLNPAADEGVVQLPITAPEQPGEAKVKIKVKTAAAQKTGSDE